MGRGGGEGERKISCSSQEGKGTKKGGVGWKTKVVEFYRENVTKSPGLESSG